LRIQEKQWYYQVIQYPRTKRYLDEQRELEASSIDEDFPKSQEGFKRHSQYVSFLFFYFILKILKKEIGIV
jgi:hypothetical protein